MHILIPISNSSAGKGGGGYIPPQTPAPPAGPPPNPPAPTAPEKSAAEIELEERKRDEDLQKKSKQRGRSGTRSALAVGPEGMRKTKTGGLLSYESETAMVKDKLG